MQVLLTKPVLWAASKFSSAPNRQQVFTALQELYASAGLQQSSKKVALLPIDLHRHRIVIFSDHHKGVRNGADDFENNEPAYLAALKHYNNEGYTYINLGDSEEFWENSLLGVLKANKPNFEIEQQFIKRKAFFKVYGNHDSLWRFDPLAPLYLKQAYGESIPVYGAIILRVKNAAGHTLDIFCTHGHQGDRQSDGNWFSAWFVNYIWAPLQSFLRINPNSPSCNDELKSQHNQYMYDWSAAQKNMLLITGHTHQPVFKSLTHLERLYLQLEEAQLANNLEAIEKIKQEIPKRQRQYSYVNDQFRNLQPTYFNTGCCCFSNGHITGIEIEDGNIRLVKWVYLHGEAIRTVAEECSLPGIPQHQQ